jgi:hypothetical protein
MRSRTSSLSATLTMIVLLACSPTAPDGEPIQLRFTSVQATRLPCRGNGPCPPSRPCPPEPPCNPQYEVSAQLHVGSVSGESLDVQSLVGELYDVHSTRAGSPQAWSLPTVPFTVGPAGVDLRLSFLTGPGAEVIGGTVRVALVAQDRYGVRWELMANAPVTGY